MRAAEPVHQEEPELAMAGGEPGHAERRIGGRPPSGLGRAEDRLSNLFSKVTKGFGFGSGESQPDQRRVEPQHLRWDTNPAAAGGTEQIPEIPAFLRRDRNRN